ncbi:(2Fe-2S)-binding protein [Streptomyces sp. 4N509B]|uniref:(2Fe-2S)-binding protein n=1 Tax=Streptomyces sp. 4N509B TaxID=3457413 RepID=UPI003FD3ED09
MYVCSCFGITEEQVREHAAAGACTPRQLASASGAGTDCGSCVRRIQGLLGREVACPRRRAAAAGAVVPAVSAVSGAPAASGASEAVARPEAPAVTPVPVLPDARPAAVPALSPLAASPA